MIYLNKLLPLLFSPLIFCSLLIVVSVFARKRGGVFAGVALLWLASTPIVSDPLFRWIEGYAVRQSAASLPMAEAIVVLSGMQRYVPGEARPVPEWGDAVDRLMGGIEVYRADKAPRMIFTGGQLPWQRDIEPEGRYLAREAIALGVDPDRVRVTRSVVNTDSEARAIRDELIGRGDSPEPHVVLVTSAFHMARAQALFEEAGFRVTPFPVDFRVSADGRAPTDYFPDADSLRRTDIAIREIIGRAYYRVRALLR